ncbi:MAG: PGF-pre-PGF domain-containing protein [Candidatus Woesearchaeota archaeon]
MQRTIIFLLIASLFLLSVSAQDFNAFGDMTVNVVPCGSAVRNVTIQNTRDVASTFTLSVDGDASNYVTFSAISFTLQPMQSAIVNTYYNIPCDVRTGTYATELFFSDGEVEKQLIQEVIVAVPDNLNLTISQTSAVIAPCETAGYTLSLQNPLNFTEIYNIRAKGHPNIHVSEKTAVLQGNERKDIIVSVTPDDCTESGTFPLTVSVEADKSNQKKEVALELIIKATDIPILAEGVNRIRTDYVDSTAEITLENTGDRITRYTVSVEGVPWASISPEKVSLNPGQKKTLSLRLMPTEKIRKGTYTATLVATVEQTGIQYSKDIIIILKPATLFERNPALFIGSIVVIAAAIVGAYYFVKYIRSPAFKEKMRKMREKREARKKAREQKRAELLRKKLELQRKAAERKRAEIERIKKQMQRKAEKEIKKDYHMVARKDLVIGKKKAPRAKIGMLILGIIVIILLASLWAIIAPNGAYVLLGIGILAVIFLAKKAARSRVIRIHWKNAIEKHALTVHGWKKGLTLLTITPEKSIKNLKLQIRKARARVAPSAAVYQTMHIKTNVTEDVTSIRATFSIPKKWLSRKQVALDDFRLARYANQTWSTVPFKKSGEDKNSIYITADIDRHGTYSIYARVQQLPTDKPFWGFIGVGLLMAVAIALIPSHGTIAHGIPPQVWQQDHVHTLDLGNYFKDPDGDKLTFTVSKTEHVSIDIIGSTVFMTPKTGWTGEERVKFGADDGKGGFVASNTVLLRVQKHLIPPRIQPTIALAVAIAALILIVWSIRSQKKK